MTTKAISLVVLFMLISFHMIGNSDLQSYSCKHLKRKPIHLRYDFQGDDENEQNIQVSNLTLPNAYSVYGKVIRTLRFENIATVIERRYCLPKGLIMAVIMQETMGEECLPNLSKNSQWGDGGFGICHIQGVVGEEFGLNTVCDASCGEFVSKYACFKHARLLGRAITIKDNCDMRKMIRRDDRLHPIMNLDAVGRILAMKKGTVREKIGHFRGGSSAVREAYFQKIQEHFRNINSVQLRAQAEAEFNKLNPDLVIDRKRSNNPFKQYIKTYHYQNVRYGLWTYARLGVCQNCCQ